MHNLFTVGWETATAVLKRNGIEDALSRDLALVETTRLPLDYLSLPADAIVIALGWGSGVLPLRLLIPPRQRRLICVEPNDACCERARAVVAELGLGNVEFRASPETALEAGSAVDLLLVDPRYASAQTLRALVDRYAITAILGSFAAAFCTDADVFRIASRAQRFDLLNATTGQRVIGRQRKGPDVTVIVTDDPLGSDAAARSALDQTMASLVAQQEIELEVIVATGRDSARVAIAQRWVEQHIGKVRLAHASNGLDVVSSALVEARGRYVAIQAAGDCSEPTMYGRMFAAAAPKQADVLIAGYREILYFDGAICDRYSFGQPSADLRYVPGTHWAGRLSGLDCAPRSGRFLVRHEYLRAEKIGWAVELGKFSPAVYIARCVLTARRIATLAECPLLHWQSHDEATGAEFCIGTLDTLTKLAEALYDALLGNDASYTRELAFRSCFYDLHLRLYRETAGVVERWRIVKALAAVSFEKWRYNSRLEFVMRKLVGKVPYHPVARTAPRKGPFGWL